MKWYRHYAEWVHDPKIQSMDETSQRRHVCVLCLMCDGSLSQLSESEIAFALHITPEELQITKKIFIEKGFIDDNWNVMQWDKRQYISDTSTERTRKWREKNGKRTSPKRHKAVTVTPPDTDTDTEVKPQTTPPPAVATHSPKKGYTHSYLLAFKEKYMGRVKEEYIIGNYGQQNSQAKTLANKLSQADFDRALDNYFASKDKWIIDNKYSWNIFVSKINNFIGSRFIPPPKPIIIAGRKEDGDFL